MPATGLNINNLYDLVLDTMSEAAVMVDAGFTISHFNRAAEELTGLKSADVLDRKCSAVLRTDRCADSCPLKALISSGAERAWEDITITSRDGRQKRVAASYGVARSGDDEPASCVITLRDLTPLDELRREIRRKYHAGEMVSRNKRLRELFEIIPEVARAETTVLVEGEAGAGKELLAHTLHALSPRGGSPFVPVDCSAIPENVAESEIFGGDGGRNAGPGRIAGAADGTIYLKQVGALPRKLQEKLIAALKERKYYPLGAAKPCELKTRVIIGLRSGGDGGRFREDLFRSVASIWFQIPALRERREDITVLIEYFLERLNAASGKNIEGFSPEAMQIIMNYEFPGNVRELENIIEHAFVVCRGPVVQKEHLPKILHDDYNKSKVHAASGRKFKPLEESEKETIFSILDKNGWNKQITSQALGITRTTLWRKMKKYGIKNPNRRIKPRS
jgi:PAS domain S-box-containing protein